MSREKFSEETIKLTEELIDATFEGMKNPQMNVARQNIKLSTSDSRNKKSYLRPVQKAFIYSEIFGRKKF